MKTTKIFLILLLSAATFISCQKSELKPCTHSSETEKVTSNDAASAARSSESVDQNTGPSDVVASGDSDRDGGDKRQKKR